MADDERLVAVRPSRRTFLKAAGAGAGVVLAGPLVLRAFGGLEAPAFAADMMGEALPEGSPILVLVDLQGGNDCLNTLVPAFDPWYYDATYGHGSLALTSGQTLALDATQYRLHPALSWLRSAWNANSPGVAFTLGVGENVTNQFSHFQAQDQWWTCDFTGTQTLGWLGRFNDARHNGEALASVCVSGLHPILVGSSIHVLAVEDVEGFELGQHWRGTWSAPGLAESMALLQAPGSASSTGMCQALYSQTYAAASTVKETFDSALLNGVTDWFAEGLVNAAMMIRGGVPCQTYVSALGAFDTHNNQADAQQLQLARLNEGLSRFFNALGTHQRRKDVVVLIYSEFGRKITMNGTNGTDHGQGGMAVAIGDRVKRGIYGQQPTLDPGGSNRPNRIYDAMRPTTDFRSVFASALNFLSGSDHNLVESIVGAGFADVGFIGPPALEMFPDDPPPSIETGPGTPVPPAVSPKPPEPSQVPPLIRVGPGGGAPGEPVAPSREAVAASAGPASAGRADGGGDGGGGGRRLDLVDAARAGADAFRRGVSAARPG